MSRQPNELKTYHNQQLMDDTSEMFIRIKVQLFGTNALKSTHKKPNNNELNMLMNRIFEELKKDNQPMRKN